MLRTRYALAALVPALALGLATCSTSEPVTESEDAIAEGEAAFVVRMPSLAGTYRSDAIRIGSLSLLVLKTDGTYHRGMVVACFTTPCPPVEEDGRYRLLRRGDMTFLTLIPDDTSGTVDHYRYVALGDTLRIVRVGELSWTSLVRTTTEAWCAERQDCELQYLPPGPCGSQFQCVESTCNHACRPPGMTE